MVGMLGCGTSSRGTLRIDRYAHSLEIATSTKYLLSQPACFLRWNGAEKMALLHNAKNSPQGLFFLTLCAQERA
jgi:hypothetical protein